MKIVDHFEFKGSLVTGNAGARARIAHDLNESLRLCRLMCGKALPFRADSVKD
jgi:hypothetical protein